MLTPRADRSGKKESTMVKQVQTPKSAKKSLGQPADASPTGTGRSGTPERDEIYGVVSVIYHALQGAETYERYVADARNAGDGELEQFFETCRTEELDRAKRAKAILLERLEDEELEDEGDESSDDDDDDDAVEAEDADE
jgi:hypothetical protein